MNNNKLNIPRKSRSSVAEIVKSIFGRFSNKTKNIKSSVSEVIGRWNFLQPLWNARILVNEDKTWQDLRWFDQFRYGLVPGYELASLYAKPIVQTLTAYIVGDGISASLSAHAVSPDINPISKSKKSLNKKGDPTNNIDYTNMVIRRMMEGHQSFFQQLINDTMSLGDQYIVVNPDCTFSVPSPETVTVQYATSDYRKPVKYVIRTKLAQALVEDVYTETERTLKITYYDTSRESIKQVYENLTGRIPIVHFSFERAVNETYGHSIFEPLVPFFRHYDDLFFKVIQGVEMVSTPIPVIENLEDVDATVARMSDQEFYTDPITGTQQTRNVVRMDRNGIIFLGKGGKSTMLAPQVGFTQDALGVLKALQTLMEHHTRLPEFLLGAAVASSKASVETQMPPFVQWIEYLRLKFEGRGANPQLSEQASGGLFELIYVWLLQYRILNPSIVVAPVQIEWPTIGLENEQFRFMWGQLLSEKGYIDPVDTVALSGEFDDPAATVAKAQGGSTLNPDFIDLDALLNQKLLDAMRSEVNLDKRDELDHPPQNLWAQDFDSTLTNNQAELPVKGNRKEKEQTFGPRGEVFNDDFLISGGAQWWPPV